MTGEGVFVDVLSGFLTYFLRGSTVSLSVLYDAPSRCVVRRSLRGLPPARALALTTLRSIIRDGVDLQAALDVALRSASLSRQDSALATELVYGYLRSEITIAWILRRHLKKPEGVPQDVLAILGLAVYEVITLDRIPHYASVDWAVEAVKRVFGQGLSRMANAVLRSVARMEAEYTSPRFYEQELPVARERFAIRYAKPLWLVDMWIDAYGEVEAEQFLAASSRHPAVGVRVNALREGACALRDTLFQDAYHQEYQKEQQRKQQGEQRKHPHGELEKNPHGEQQEEPEVQDARERVEPYSAKVVGSYGIMFARGCVPSSLEELHRDGRLSRQSGASQGVLDALQPSTWRAPVWDCCCGRGGKTAFLVEQGIAVMAASDTNKGRLKDFVADFSRLQLDVPVLFCAPAEEGVKALHTSPGTVLVDAPCSGLGTLSRRPDIALRRTPEQIEALVVTQQRILDAVWAALPAGGMVAYITCTRNHAENQNQVARLLTLHNEAVLLHEYETAADDPSCELFYGALIQKGS